MVELRRLLFTLIAFVVISSAKPVMTNQTVEAMVVGGVPVATILTAIKTAEYIQLFTSTEFRDRLLNAGASRSVADQIVQAMHDRNYKGVARPEDVNPVPVAVALARPSVVPTAIAQPVETSAPVVPPSEPPATVFSKGASPQAVRSDVSAPEPEFADVFFRLDGGNLVPLERQTATVRGKAKFGGYGGIKVASEFKPEKSPVRFKSREQLQFVVRSFAASVSTVDPATLYSLRALTKNGDKRELVMTESHGPLGLGGATSNLAEGVLPVKFEKFGEHSLKIVPGTALPPGEYALSRRAGMMDLFCFGVD